MLDYQRIVEEIRSFLQAVDQTYSDQVRDLAARYAEACREVNQRLRRCEEFLQKGLRSEAIHLAQAEPILLDVVAILDFLELDTWREIVMAYSLPASPKLLLATAEALNEAYTIVQPLEHLLKKHRLLALSRAPLPERLGVLRQIVALDGGNPVWTDDIRAFEKVRVRQLEQEVEGALYNQDKRTLERVFGEIRSTAWVDDPPVGLIHRVENLARQASAKQLRESLQTVANEIRAAVAAGDVDRVRRLRDRWNAEALRGGLPLDDPLWRRVGAGFDWLNEQDRQRAEERKQKAALLKLESALNDNAAPEELERLYRAAVLRDGGVPEVLEGHYHVKVQSLRGARDRRRRRILAVCLVAGLALGATAVFMIYEAIQENRVQQRVQTLKGLRDSGDWEEAGRYLEQLDADEPRAAAAPEIGSLRKQITTEVARERRRVADFQEALRDAENSPLEERDHFAQALARGRTLSRLPDERRAVDRLGRDREEKVRAWQRQRDQDFQGRVRELRGKIEKLEASPDDPEMESTWQKLREAASLLEQEAKDVSDSLRGQPAALQNQLDAIRRNRGRKDKESQLVDGLTAALRGAGGEEEYVKAMRAYLEEYRFTPRGKNFQRVLVEEPLWRAALAWSRLLPSRPAGLLAVRFDEARSLAGKLREFQKAHPQFVDAKLVGEYLLYLEAVVQQDEKDAKSAAFALREVFKRRTMRDVWVLTEQDKTYYLAHDPQPKIRQAREDGLDLVGIHYLSGLDATEAVQNVRRERITRTYRAPQAEIADAVLHLPIHFADPDWETAASKVAEMIRDKTDLDPILQLSLLKEVFALAAKGSRPLALALAERRRQIQQANLDLEVPWLNPVSDSARRTRPQARKLAAALPSLKMVAEVVAAKKSDLERELSRSRRELAGWLAWEKDHWQFRPGATLTGDRVLGIVYTDADKMPAWKSIGTLAAGKAAFANDKDETLVEGQLIFAVPIEKK